MMRQAEQLDDFERKSQSFQASQASEALGHGDPRLLSRQNSDYVRPSWAIQGGSRGDHVFNLTSELEVREACVLRCVIAVMCINLAVSKDCDCAF